MAPIPLRALVISAAVAAVAAPAPAHRGPQIRVGIAQVSRRHGASSDDDAIYHASAAMENVPADLLFGDTSDLGYILRVEARQRCCRRQHLYHPPGPSLGRR
jgi:hypothetical protein